MIFQSIFYVFSELYTNTAQKLSAWSDDIWIELLLGDLLLQLLCPCSCNLELIKKIEFFTSGNLRFESSSKSSGPLLVHFSSWGNTIDSQIQCLSRSHNIHQLVDVLVNIVALLLEVVGNFDIFPSRVTTRMN